MTLSLNDRAFDCLKVNKGKMFSVTGLARLIFDTYPNECADNRKARTTVYKTDQDYVTQLASEISAHRENLQSKYPNVQIAGKPRKYFYADEMSDGAIDSQVVEASIAQAQFLMTDEKFKLNEFDLYPMLFRFARDEFHVPTMRIDEKKSVHSGGKNWNKWLHPDMVGLEVFGNRWEDVVRKCLQQSHSRRIRVWSFEVKKALITSNVRESFFQAVSNSSWANFGYLVAAGVDDKAENELRILSQVHGIGVIKLNTSDPIESEVLIPARERPEIDWDSANRLAAENSNFQLFLEIMWQFFRTDKLKDSDWPEPAADGSASF